MLSAVSVSAAGQGAASALWILVAATVAIAIVPGLALFYGRIGGTGSASARSILGSVAVTTVIWIAFGYGTAFGEPLVPGLLGDPSDSIGLLPLLGVNSGGAMAPRLDGLVNAGFHLVLAIVAVTLIAAALGDRVRLAVWLSFVAAWVSLVYLPVAYWVFNSDGWAATIGVTDLAGGTVVQISAGATALALLFVLRKRSRLAPAEVNRGRSDSLALLGVGLAWMGWLGMNAGAEAAVDGTTALIWINTLAAPAAGILAWLLEQKLRGGDVTAHGAASGALAGLVAITPACGILTPVWAMVLGLAAGALCSAATRWGRRGEFGDSFAVVGIHLIGGLTGVLFIGVAGSAIGLIYNGSLASLGAQIATAAGVAAYSFAVAWLLALILEKSAGLGLVPRGAEVPVPSVSAGT